MFATVPYEMVMRPGPHAGPTHRVEGVARAMQLGLHDELTGLDEERLDALAAFGDDGLPIGERTAAAGRVGGALGTYLGATLAHASGAEDAAAGLEEAIPGLPGTHAEVRARVGLAALGGSADLPRAISLAPHLEREINSYSSSPDTLRAVLASQLGVGAEAPQPPTRRSRLEALSRRFRPERQSR
jgi:hypothetical protein